MRVVPNLKHEHVARCLGWIGDWILNDEGKRLYQMHCSVRVAIYANGTLGGVLGKAGEDLTPDALAAQICEHECKATVTIGVLHQLYDKHFGQTDGPGIQILKAEVYVSRRDGYSPDNSVLNLHIGLSDVTLEAGQSKEDQPLFDRACELVRTMPTVGNQRQRVLNHSK